MSRKGMMVGRGSGYKNVVGRDPHIHSQSAKGIKQPQRIPDIKGFDMPKNIYAHCPNCNQSYNVLDGTACPVYSKKESPKLKEIMTEDEAEKLYKYELAEGIINGDNDDSPYYDSFEEYKNMLKDMGTIIKR